MKLLKVSKKIGKGIKQTGLSTYKSLKKRSNKGRKMTKKDILSQFGY